MCITVRPKQLASILSKCITAQLPVLITGAPGVGKSEIVEQAARVVGADVVLSHPVVSDPTDAKGLPWKVEGRDAATFLPYGELERALNAAKPTVWFLDDLGQATPAVQASFMQLLLARHINGHALPDCVTFVAATNRRQDRAGVSGVLEPVKSRFATIVELMPTMEDWVEWALSNNVSPWVMAFMRFRPELLHKFTPSPDMVNSPSPRTWAQASKLLALDLPGDLELAALAGAVGEGAAGEFVAFLRDARALPDLDAILASPETAPVPDQPSTLYAVVSGLASRCTVETFPAIAAYTQRLGKAGHGEFSVLLLRDASRREPKTFAMKEFSDVIQADDKKLGSLICGTAGEG